MTYKRKKKRKEGWGPAEEKQTVFTMNDGLKAIGWAVLDTVLLLLAIMAVAEMAKPLFKSAELMPFVYLLMPLYGLISNLVNEVLENSRYYRYRLLAILIQAAVMAYILYRTVMNYYSYFLLGMTGMADQLIGQINKYYGRHLPYVSSGNASIPPLAFTVLACGLMVIFQSIALIRDRKILLFVPATICLIGLLSLGLAPETKACVIFALGVIVCQAPSTVYKKDAVNLVWLMLLLLISGFVGFQYMAEPAETVKGQYKQMIAFQKDMEKQAKAFAYKLQGKAGGADSVSDGSVSNQFPAYDNVEVFTVSSVYRATDTLYLRAYFADTYKGEEWLQKADFANKGDARSLNEYQNASNEEINAQIGNQLCNALQSYDEYVESVESFYEYVIPDSMTEYRIEYTNLNLQDMLVPVASYWTAEGAGKGQSISKEGQLLKAAKSGPYYVTGLLDSKLFMKDWGRYATPYIDKESKEGRLYAAYENYVNENYLQVPSNQVSAMALAEELADNENFRWTAETYNSMVADYDQVVNEYGDMADQFIASALNQYRMYAAEFVKGTLQNRMKYSKNLTSDQGMDPVEYALSVSGKGFCVHYASAATFILRSMGIPTRYCTGYIVSEKEFRKDLEGTYTASVKDSKAHAWVEIYLSGIGWVPFEMTPGFENGADSNRVDYTEWEDARTEKPSESQSSETETGDTETENTETESQETESQEIESQMTESQMTESQMTEASETDLDGSGTGQGQKQKGLSLAQKIILSVLLLLALVGGIVLALKRREALWEQKLNNLEKKELYNKAAKEINQRVYKNLNLKRKKNWGLSDDTAFAKTLKEYYPDIDWKTYIVIMKKAVFSCESIRREEYQIIKKNYQSMKEEKKREKRA